MSKCPYFISVNKITVIFLVVACLSITKTGNSWGLAAHRDIAQSMVQALPSELGKFYRANLRKVCDAAILPDIRKNYHPITEGPNHYISLDLWPDSLLNMRPSTQTTAESILFKPYPPKWGTVIFNINIVTQSLTKAMAQHNTARTLQLTGELCHYVSDLCVPLHTITSYDGYTAAQKGIHKLWETDAYKLLNIPTKHLAFASVSLIPNITDTLYTTAIASFNLANSIMISYDSANIQSQRLYVTRNQSKHRFSQSIYAHPAVISFSQHQAKVITNRYLAATNLTASLVYTCWLTAGQPNLLSFPQVEKPLLSKAQQQDLDNWQILNTLDCDH